MREGTREEAKVENHHHGEWCSFVYLIVLLFHIWVFVLILCE